MDPFQLLQVQRKSGGMTSWYESRQTVGTEIRTQGSLGGNSAGDIQDPAGSEDRSESEMGNAVGLRKQQE